MLQMPRNYKRRTEKTYILETLKSVLYEIKEKELGFRETQQKYGIPQWTLFEVCSTSNRRLDTIFLMCQKWEEDFLRLLRHQMATFVIYVKISNRSQLP